MNVVNMRPEYIKKNVSNIKYIRIYYCTRISKLLLVSISVQYLSLFLSLSLFRMQTFHLESIKFFWIISFRKLKYQTIWCCHTHTHMLQGSKRWFSFIVCHTKCENLWQIEVRCVILFTILHFVRTMLNRINMIIQHTK